MKDKKAEFLPYMNFDATVNIRVSQIHLFLYMLQLNKRNAYFLSLYYITEIQQITHVKCSLYMHISRVNSLTKMTQ